MTDSTTTRPWWTRITRDRVLFVAGLLGIAHEAVAGAVTERPVLLLVFTAMVGLPAFLPGAGK